MNLINILRNGINLEKFMTFLVLTVRLSSKLWAGSACLWACRWLEDSDLCQIRHLPHHTWTQAPLSGIRGANFI